MTAACAPALKPSPFFDEGERAFLIEGRKIPLSSCLHLSFLNQTGRIATQDASYEFTATCDEIEQLRHLTCAQEGSPCPSCSLPFKRSGAAIEYCPHCQSLFSNEQNLCMQGKYIFNFTSSGDFAFLGKIRPTAYFQIAYPLDVEDRPITDSFTSQVSPILWRIFSNAAYLTLWLMLAFFLPLPLAATLLLMGLTLVHMTLIGTYCASLAFNGCLTPLIRTPKPPCNPLTAALAARDYKTLLALCPTHPLIQSLAT